MKKEKQALMSIDEYANLVALAKGLCTKLQDQVHNLPVCMVQYKSTADARERKKKVKNTMKELNKAVRILTLAKVR